MNKTLPVTLKQLAVEVNVPVRELVKLYKKIEIHFPAKPSVKITPEHIESILPLIKQYLREPYPSSKSTMKRFAKKQKNSKKTKSGKRKMSKQIEKEIYQSIDGFGNKVYKKPKVKSDFKVVKPVIISTPMKS